LCVAFETAAYVYIPAGEFWQMASNRKGKGEIASRGRIADLCGVSAPTVDNWIALGCPVVTRGGRGRAYEFNSADVVAWRISRAAEEAAGAAPQTEQELRIRRLRALTELDELELAKARGEVAPIAQMSRAMDLAFAEVRGALRAVPSRAARRVVGETDEARLKAVLLEEIDQALEALADADLVDDDDLQGAADAAA
jgi:phage terminase Nu1 subunit (DNA packaging protein)